MSKMSQHDSLMPEMTDDIISSSSSSIPMAHPAYERELQKYENDYRRCV